MLVCVSVCPMHCGKMADWIWMRIGMVSQDRSRDKAGLGIGPREAVILGTNVRCLIVTNGELT